ncbi:MAG: hypothetical protein O9256_01460 [Rhizobiaceae bacterium]|nr:hypothetical protein [Rhizobiaceae bacterium]
MPTLTQGNVFDAAQRTPLAVVFGYTGFNLMSMYWREFAQRTHKLSNLANPFRDRPRQPIEWAEGRWLWMVPCTAADGLTDAEHEQALGEAVAWALQNGIGSIVTNGAPDTSSDVKSQSERAVWLIAYASNLEKSQGIEVELISLSDVYIARASTTPARP